MPRRTSRRESLNLGIASSSYVSTPATDGEHVVEAELRAQVGDVVGFKENRDYRIKIDGKEYYRTRVEDLLYVEV